MSPEEKEDQMLRFNQGKIDLLVSTTVIEVGIDNPNAVSIVIECAHSMTIETAFGLSIPTSMTVVDTSKSILP